ncbi:hypothetical protein B0A48_18767 [Cryoendolithus antarcticus]|uniref:CHAT domain-containing protein n=1 Tax=Cryoendolithus antarcticus TaxID=1507870 RepID=A0A1V8S876_9PEZI|nr:hypothetical protein B0A48_18767 [Cryoendolithus antarcticus]
MPSPSFVQRIIIKHPAYSGSNTILALPACDGTNASGQAHYVTVYSACVILANNRKDGWLSSSRSGVYFFHIECEPSAEPYPVIPNFRAWVFPHNDLPSLWHESAQIAATIEPRTATETCRLTNKRLACENAHIIPAAEKSWFVDNEMDQYGELGGRTGQDVADSPTNSIRLRRDVHILWDNMFFSIVPKKPQNCQREGLQWYAHSMVQDEELYADYHNQPTEPLAGRAVELLQPKLEYEDASAIAKGALALLPTLSTRALSQRDRQSMIALFSGLAADACALRLQCGNGDPTAVDKALELLEAGRGSLIGLALEDRHDVTNLRTSWPQHASRLGDLRAMLNVEAGSTGDSAPRASQQISPFKTLQDFHACVDEIRTLPGFGDFMMSPSIEEMKAAAVDGVVVVVNVGTLRSDALVVKPQAVRLIKLRHFDVDKARSWMAEIKGWSSESPSLEQSGRQNARYRVLLLWLWKSCVRDIMEGLGYRTHQSGKTLPRVWWIGTGVASSLPFHAAGRHCDSSTSTTSNVVISSYVPTIRALVHARGRAMDVSSYTGYEHKILLATMETTRGEPPLHGVRAEADAVKSAVGIECRVTHQEQTNAEAVLRLLPSNDMFHFAGHGMSDPVDPAESCIVFEKSDGASMPMIQDRLQVDRLFGANLQPAFLAFLSACSTAQNQQDVLADESIHLASGFLVAGFRHVIGCLWPSSDEVCVDVAREFYRALNMTDGKGVKDKALARALHFAVGKVYAIRRDHPFLWAQYIHMGA